MPYIYPSTYKAPGLRANKHFQTIYHSEFRKVPGIEYSREKIGTPDGDFLNIDWHTKGNGKAAILVHGLESSSDRPYMKGMVKALSERGFDCAAMLLRSCGGEMNRKPMFYHAGKTDDLDLTVSHVKAKGYSTVCLVGFSLGGNIILKYLGERGRKARDVISCAAAVSTPCDLASSTDALEKFSNKVYNKRFVKKLIRKIRGKLQVLPGFIDEKLLRKVKTLKDYDNIFTAQMLGYADGAEYYRRESSLPLLPEIAVPTLLINAKDDPFLGKKCFPIEEAERSSMFYFEETDHGGHMGFLTVPSDGEYWHETRVSEFLLSMIEKGGKKHSLF
jgi:predicted alpha/beta-fold hydrolase